MQKSCVVFALAAACVSQASADEEMRKLAASGSWVAAAHAESMTARPNICMAFNLTSKFLVRYDGTTISLRLVNDSWALPTDVQGSMSINVGSVSKEYQISDNTDKMVSSDITEEDMRLILSEMAKSSSMLVKVGKDKPINVSLTGISKVTNAFLTCSGLRGSSTDTGNNPFK